MDLNKFLNLSQRKKRLIILLALFGCSSYGVYKFYQSSYVSNKTKRIAKILHAVISIIEMVSDSAETVSVVSKDLNEFLLTDSNRIPASLKQLAKIASSDEFSMSMVRVTQAVTVGVTRGYQSTSGDMKEKELEKQENNSSFCDQIMDKLVSGVGTGFVSVVVGSFARNMVLALLNRNQDSVVSVASSSGSDSLLTCEWADFLCDEKSKLIIADCIKTFVGTGVSVYLDKTMNINVYNDIFSGLTNPKHQSEVRDFLVMISNGAVETLVKTSHEVLTSSNPNPGSSSSSSFSIPTFSYSGDRIAINDENSRELKERNYGWVDSVSSTLAVPSNRAFVLDVTGRVTFETIRSVLDFIVWKLSESLKRSRTVVHEGIVDRGREVISYVGVKSCIALFVVCLALYLHVIRYSGFGACLN